MDSLVTSRRPIKNVKVVSNVKCKKALAPLRRARPAAEAVPVPERESVPEQAVSFVSLYNDVCREGGGIAPAFFKRWEPRGLGAGDTAPAPLAQLVLEIDY